MKFGMNPSPYFRAKRSTTQIMGELMIGLAVIWVCAIIYYFTTSAINGVFAIVNPLIAMVVAVLIEACFMLPKHIKEKGSFVSLVKKLLNSYGYVTGMILALLLPVGTSVYAIVISTIFAVAVGKMLFGGFGHNIFNPAILGRIFAQTAFMGQMSYDANPEIVTGSTVTTMLGQNGWSIEMLSLQDYSLLDLLIGNYRGTLGETFTIVLVVVAVVLAIRRVIDWRAPAFYVGTTFVATFFMGLVGGYGLSSFEFALIQISIGGVMFGAVFCITDPVTTPTSPAGRIFYGIGAAVVTMLIRYMGSMPEGVAFSILLMNAFTPLIDSAIKGLTSQNKIKNIVTASVMGAVAITAGCAIGANDVNKAQFINYINENRQETGDLQSTVEKVSEKGGISTYHVAVKGIIGTNTTVELGDIKTLFADELASYNQYFENSELYEKAKYVVKKSGNNYSLQLTYTDLVDNNTKKTIDIKVGEENLSLTPVDEGGKWKIHDVVTEYSTTDYEGIYNVSLNGTILTIEFADDHNSSMSNYASYATVEFNISLNYKDRLIVGTEYISCGGGGGYGDVLVSENGGTSSAYFEYMQNKDKAVQFYNKYIKIETPVSFDVFTTGTQYDTFVGAADFENPSADLIINCGSTYTAVGYVTLIQRVIEFAEADHTVGKVSV